MNPTHAEHGPQPSRGRSTPLSTDVRSVWNRTDQVLPDNDTRCDVITESGEQRQLIFESNLWWLPDFSMYVYFTPVFWRPA